MSLVHVELQQPITIFEHDEENLLEKSLAGGRRFPITEVVEISPDAFGNEKYVVIPQGDGGTVLKTKRRSVVKRTLDTIRGVHVPLFEIEKTYTLPHPHRRVLIGFASGIYAAGMDRVPVRVVKTMVISSVVLYEADGHEGSDIQDPRMLTKV